MQDLQIVFTGLNTAELIPQDIPEMTAKSVKVKTAVSTVSAGTERANITGDPSVALTAAPEVTWPRKLGYSSAGTVVEVGPEVTYVKPGDKVVVFWGKHRQYNVVDESRVVKMPDGISFEEAAVTFIGTFPLAAVRKTKVELGESGLVMGLGMLGQFAVRFLRAAGATPVIACDPVAERRELALAGGADYALDPFEKDFAEKVKELSRGGVNAAIEVTGVGAGLDETLDCMARFGRVALLGCTRNSNFSIDYYRKVHSPGISLIGAHTKARPEHESYPGYFTHNDDIEAIMNLCLGGRMEIKSMIKETHSPEDCGEVYTRLINDRNFPIVVQFDWRTLEK